MRPQTGEVLAMLRCCFTEHGVLQVANVLNSEQANKMSVYIIKAFVKMRQAIIDISLNIEKHEKS